MEKEVVIFVNGILTFPGSSDNWNRRATTHFHTTYGIFAETLEYLTPALTRFLFAKKRAAKLSKKLHYYQRKGFKIHLVGHSNGANVIFNCLKMDKEIRRIESIQLFSPACPEDASKVGLDKLFADGRLGRFKLYRAGNDLPLKAAGLLGRIVGYGAMGLRGVENIDHELELAGVVQEHFEPMFGHSNWFKDMEFQFFMREARDFVKDKYGRD